MMRTLALLLLLFFGIVTSASAENAKAPINGIQVHAGPHLGFGSRTIQSFGVDIDQNIRVNPGVNVNALYAFARFFAVGINARLGNQEYEVRDGVYTDRVWLVDFGGVFRFRFPFQIGDYTAEPFIDLSGGMTSHVLEDFETGYHFGFEIGGALYFSRTIGAHLRAGWRRQGDFGEGRTSQIHFGAGISLRI